MRNTEQQLSPDAHCDSGETMAKQSEKLVTLLTKQTNDSENLNEYLSNPSALSTLKNQDKIMTMTQTNIDVIEDRIIKEQYIENKIQNLDVEDQNQQIKSTASTVDNFKTSFLNEIIKKYGIEQDQEQDFRRSFCQQKFKECIESVKKKQREQITNDIQIFVKKIQEITNKQGKSTQKQLSVQNYVINQDQFVKSIFEKFQIDSQDKEQFLEYLKKQNAEQCAQYAKKKYREMIKKQILVYLENKNSQLLPTKVNQKQIQQQLNNLLVKFEIQEDQVPQCIQLIQEGDTDSVLQFVKKKKRNQLKIQLERFTLHYQRTGYKNVREGVNKMHSLPKGLILTIKIGELIKEVKVKDGVQELRKILSDKFGIEQENHYDLQFGGKKIKNLDQVLISAQKEGLLKLIKKITLKFEYNFNIYNIWVKQSSSSQTIKQQIMGQLNNKKLFIGDINSIFMKFCTQKQEIKQFENLKEFIQNYSKINKIVVQNEIQVTVYYEQTNKVFKMKSLDRIINLKRTIQKDFIPLQCQLLEIEYNNEKKRIKQDQEQQLITKFIVNNDNHLQLLLSNSHTSEYYGFNCNYSLTFQKFNQFTIENDQQLIRVIKNCDFTHANEEKIFFDTFISYLFSCMKKRFPMQIIIDKIKQLVVKNKFEGIWSPIEDKKPRKMNQTFLLMYLLRNSNERLKIQLMNLVKNLMPIPLQINNFQSIYELYNIRKQNQNIIWILKKGITICSIGLHNQQNKANQQGKSDLLNKLFYSNFCLADCKHKIIERIPFIATRVYDDLFPLNVIDLPYNCQQKIKNKLIQISDIVLIHSWRDQRETVTFANSLEKKNESMNIILMRDIKQCNKCDLKTLSQTRLEQSNILKLKNLQNYESIKDFVDIVREKINLFLLSVKEKIINSKRIFNFVQNQELGRLFEIMSKFQQNQTNMCIFSKHSYLLDKANKQQKQNNLIAQLKGKFLNPEIQNFLKFINKSRIPQDIILMHFRQKLRSNQNEIVNKYMIIYKIKQKLTKCKDNQFEKTVQTAHNQLKNLSLIYNKERSLLLKSREQVLKIMDQISSDFENVVKPQIFSIEIFWRQVCSYAKFNPDFVIGNQSLFDLITDIKKKQIMNNQPFEIIDGDCLEMPKQIMKKVFGSIHDKCLVLTILGPQSSGKSTLLNFLFGCDFATSQGRCTRGVYGTYFRLNDPRIKNFEGIFVIDTEGLFALTNQNDQRCQDRENFDSKLVLFCLAISDLVVINVRGNLDKNTQKILSICNEKLQALGLKQNERPDIIIVLNQNNTSKTEESQNQFKKIRKSLNFDISKSLSLAYSIKNYGKDEICLLEENQIVTKKVPFPQFHAETTNLLNQISERMMKKSNTQQIIQKIEKFLEIWSTILSFPNLSQMTTKQYRELESEIKTWKKQKDEKNQQQFNQLTVKYKSQAIDQERATAQVEKISLQLIEQFKGLFSKQALNKQLRSLFQNELKQIIMKKDLNFKNLKFAVTQINLQKQINREIFQGDSILRNLERQIIKNQNDQTKVYSIDQKQKIFNQGFNQALSKIQKSMKISDKRNNQLERIKNDYEFLIKKFKSQISQCGLPKLDKKITVQYMTQKSYSDIQQSIVKNLLKQINELSKFMKYTDKLYTNVFKNSLSDAKLKYFNMKDYFHKQTKTKKYFLTYQSLVGCFNFDKFLREFQQINYEVEQLSSQKQIVRQIFQGINQNLGKFFDLRMVKFENFYSIYKQKNSFFLKRVFSSWQSLQLKRDDYHHFDKSRSRIIGNSKEIVLDFIRINIFDIFEQNYQKQQKFRPISHIQKTLKQRIQWKKIKQRVVVCLQSNQEQRKIHNKKIQQINKRIVDQLNMDLAILNLRIPYNTNIKRILDQNFSFLNPFYNANKIGEYIFQFIQSIDQQNMLKDQASYFYKLGELKYFYGKNLQQNFKLNPKFISKDFLKIANFNFQIMVSNEQYFNGYIQSDKSMKDKLRSKKFEQFIFNQITKEKRSLELLLTQICKIVKETYSKWGKFQSKSISQVFCLINQELSQFNNDLNQISYQLHPIIVGEIHLIAIYLIWKLELDFIQQKEHELYDKKLQSRKSQLKRFMIRTSNNINSIISDQVQQFTEHLIEKFQQYIKAQKEDLFNLKKSLFDKNYNRQFVQSQVDLQIFKKITSPQIILQYLEKPYEILLAKYQQNYSSSWDQLKRQFSKHQFVSELMKQLEDILNEMGKTLENVDKITEEKANPRDLFEVVKSKSVKNNDYDEEAKKILYQYFEDKILGRNQNKQRDCLQFKVKLRQNLTKVSSAKGILCIILQKFNSNKLKMTNLIKFLNIFLNEVNQQFLKVNLGRICEFSVSEQKKFLNKIRVRICKQKCPCCARICGIQETHSAHKCLYGHQMRALGGNYVQLNGKKQAYVVRCEMLKQTDIMQYNGNTYTWTKFKQYWSSKPTGGWLYDDIIKGNQKRQQIKRFQHAWLIAGPLFCQKQGIEYVQYNNAEKQLQQYQENIAKTHFIFALDQSSSMNEGKRWEDLIKAISQIVKKIKSRSVETFISIITFNHKATVIYQRSMPQNINVFDISYHGGSTNFQVSFQKAYQLANKYIHQQKITFIFMTDGGSTYPQNSIKLFHGLMQNYPRKFKYFGIEFNSNQNVMKLIQTALKGTNLQANNYQQLLEAYTSCLEIIAYKQDQNKVMDMSN